VHRRLHEGRLARPVPRQGGADGSRAKGRSDGDGLSAGRAYVASQARRPGSAASPSRTTCNGWRSSPDRNDTNQRQHETTRRTTEPPRTISRFSGEVVLVRELVPEELDDQVEFALSQDRLNRTNDPGTAADRDPLSNLERPFARQPAGRDHLLAAAQLVAIRKASHRRPPTIRPRSDSPRRFEQRAGETPERIASRCGQPWIVSGVCLTGGLPRLQNRLRGSAPRTCRCPVQIGEQRRRALASQANEVRSARATLKKQLAAGTIQLAQILAAPPAVLETTRLRDLLIAVPKIGPVKAARILAYCRIAHSKTLGGLTDRQRRELISLLHR
jgi:hypothetical protein